ncbi:MAG: DnaJ-class molecular chaperone with C-terminal Zn finger domain [Planctomycetota bacterium]|nr:DnaJ-class molecular chaperone with C-terminal Zn finger domain [Planctomycetota bacterium]
MLDGQDLDPYTVLGLTQGCSAEEVRDAYHKKSKKHHPDQGGDAWAFKIVVRAYEALNQILERERAAALSRVVADTGRIRPGVQDKGVDPARIVHVEMVWMRYEVGDLLAMLGDRTENRNLSGSLNIMWPGEDFASRAESLPNADKILRALNAAFDEIRIKTKPTGARSQIEDGRFDASIGYANGQTAWEAFKLFHVGLKARGLGVKQWTRDVTIPRDHAE